MKQLPPRGNRIPGQIQNEAKELRAQRQKEEEDLKQQKELMRKDRHSKIKKQI